MIKHKYGSIVFTIYLTAAFAAKCFAGDEFQIPDQRAKDLIGIWIVTKVGNTEELKTVTPDRAIILDFRADGSGAVQKRGEHENQIVWGGNDKGVFSSQRKQEDGNGDGVMGKWKKTKNGIKLFLREYEDGKHPEEYGDVLIIQRVKNTGLPSKEEGK